MTTLKFSGRSVEVRGCARANHRFIVCELQRDVTVVAQLLRHDIEQRSVDAEDGCQRGLVVDVLQDAERVAEELLDTEDPHRVVACGKHFVAAGPAFVEFQRFRIGRAHDLAVAAEHANVLDAGTLVDEQSSRLKLRWIATDRSAKAEPVERSCAIVCRVFRAAERDVAQLLQLLGLLLLDQRPRGKMPARDEGQRGHCQNEQTGKAWPLRLHEREDPRTGVENKRRLSTRD